MWDSSYSRKSNNDITFLSNLGSNFVDIDLYLFDTEVVGPTKFSNSMNFP